MNSVRNVISYPLDGAKSETLALEANKKWKDHHRTNWLFQITYKWLKSTWDTVLSVSTNLCVGSVLRPRVFLHGALFFDVRADTHKCRPAHRERRCGLREVKVTFNETSLRRWLAHHLSNTVRCGACNSESR